MASKQQETVGILGGFGFVGRATTQKLTDAGYNVIIGSRASGVDARITKSVCAWIIENNITKIINLAAECGGIGLNQRKPAELWAASTQISFSSLEASRICNIQKYVAVGTVCSYAANCVVPFKEDYLMNYGMPEETNRGYGIAKLNGLIGAAMYAKQYNMNIACVIPVNMYGPHDNFSLEDSHVIPALIRKILEAKVKNEQSVKLWGDGSPTREFLYVGDCAEALHKALLINTSTDPINIGSGQEISIKDLATKITNLVEYSGELIWDVDRPNGQMRRCLDVSKAKEKLGFTASTDLDTGLKYTIEWFKTSKYWRA